MNAKIPLFIIILIFCSCFVLGADFYYKKNEIIDLKIGCYKNGANCPGNISCNITIIYPNSSVFINNGAMVYHPSFYSYQITNSRKTGEYKNMMVCTENITSTYSLFSF